MIKCYLGLEGVAFECQLIVDDTMEARLSPAEYPGKVVFCLAAGKVAVNGNVYDIV